MIGSAPSTNQYVAYASNNEYIDTTDSTGLKQSTIANPPTDSIVPTSETNSSGNDVATTMTESETVLDQPFTIADSSALLGIPYQHYKADLQACRRVTDENLQTRFVIYHVQNHPFDITVATEGVDKSWSDFKGALQHAEKGYAIIATKDTVLGIVNYMNGPQMSETAQMSYIKQGDQFFLIVSARSKREHQCTN